MATSNSPIRPPQKQDLALSDKTNDYLGQYGRNLALPEDQIILSKGGGRYQIYRELLRDEQVKSCFQQRRLALIGKDWDIRPGEDNNPQAQAAADALKLNLQNIEWDRIADRMLYGIHFGYSVGRVLWNEFGQQPWAPDLWGFKDVKVHDLTRFAFGYQGELYLVNKKYPKGLLLQTYHDARAILPEGRGKGEASAEFWVFNSGGDHDDDPYGMGLAHSLYWHVFYKRQDVRFWLRFLEKFSTPTHTASADNAHIENPAHRKKILDVLGAMIGDAGVIVPDWLEVKLLESTRTGAVDFDAIRDMADRAIAKIIVSQTMTTEQEGGQYKADTAKDVRDEVIEADADLLAGSFNSSVAAWFTLCNFGADCPVPRLHWEIEAEEDSNKRAERDTKIFAMGFKPTADYIEENYGDGWEEKPAPGFGATLGAPGAPPAGPGEKPPTPPGFAEATTEQQILDAMSGHVGDQARMKDSAALMGRSFRKVLGPRVEELLAYAEESDDLQTFRKHLAAMFEEQPSPETVETIQDQGIAARLAGLFRKQR